MGGWGRGGGGAQEVFFERPGVRRRVVDATKDEAVCTGRSARVHRALHPPNSPVVRLSERGLGKWRE